MVTILYSFLISCRFGAFKASTFANHIGATLQHELIEIETKSEDIHAQQFISLRTAQPSLVCRTFIYPAALLLLSSLFRYVDALHCVCCDVICGFSSHACRSADAPWTHHCIIIRVPFRRYAVNCECENKSRHDRLFIY